MKKNGFFTKRTLSSMLVVAFGVLLYVAMANLGTVSNAFGKAFRTLSPFLLGIGLAYLLNLPMRFLEKRVFRKLKHKKTLALIATYALTLLAIALILMLVVPELGASILTLRNNMDGYITNINGLTAWLGETLHLDVETRDFITLSYKDIIDQLTVWLQNAWPDILNTTVQVGSGIVSTLTAFIASLYMLASRDKLLVQMRRVVYAVLPKKAADETYRIARLSNTVFSGFITGKLLDSLIIGVICYLFMGGCNLINFLSGGSFIEMPYPLLISIIIAITNIIPFFGPFIGAIPSTLFILLVNPWSALWFVVFVIVLQQIDGNIIGPKILGDSTGLPGLWVLISIVVGGGWFGFMGMLLGVPTAAVLYALFSDIVAKRLGKKQLDDNANVVPAKPAAPPEGESMDADSGMD